MRFIRRAPPTNSCGAGGCGGQLDQACLAAAHHQVGGPYADVQGTAHAGAADDGHLSPGAQTQGQHTGAQTRLATDGGDAGGFSGE